MSVVIREDQTRKKKKGAVGQNTDRHSFVSWKEKKVLADKEEEMVGKEVEELLSWTSLIESMDDNQLKEYVMNVPKHLRAVKVAKSMPSKRAPRNGKSKCSSSNGLMEAIWKFHREDDEETSARLKT